MKVKVITDAAHDTTVGEVYETIPAPSFNKNPEDHEVWIIDDIGDEYILLEGEYEVIE